MSQIKLSNVSKNYRRKTVLSNINVTFKPGRITAVLGLNGVGKTTLLNIIAGNESSSQGSVFFNGILIDQVDKVTDIVFIPDKIILPKFITIKEIEVLFLRRNPNFDQNYITEILEILEIDNTCILKNLSKGSQELIQIAFLTANKPSFIIMDEPLGAIDIVKRKYIIKKLIDLQLDGVGIILSTHLISEVEDLVTDVTILKNNTLSEVIEVDDVISSGYNDINDYLIKNI